MADKVTVTSGQSLKDIAKKNNTTVAEIIKVNPKLTTDPKYKNGKVVFNGTIITLPTSKEKKPAGNQVVTPPTGVTPATTVTPQVQVGQGAGGDLPVVQTGISSTVGTKTDTLSMEQLQAQYSIAAGVIGSDKSLQDALNRILGTGGRPMITDAALQKQIIQATDWYRKQTDAQRAFSYAKETNPGQFQADLQLNASAIVKQFAENGLKITAKEAIDYANQMMSQAVIKDGKVVRYDQSYINDLMSKAIDFSTKNIIGGTKDASGKITGGTIYYDMAGKLETMANSLYQQAYEYGYPSSVSNERFSTWFESSMKGLVAGTLNVDDVDNELQTRAISMFPGLKDQLMQGQTLRAAANPWLNAIANTWEVDPRTIDLNNDYVQRTLNNSDEKGNVVPMNLYEAKKTARRSPNFDFTSAAKEEKTGIASTILKDFGFLG